jgi:hypothetical protein
MLENAAHRFEVSKVSRMVFDTVKRARRWAKIDRMQLFAAMLREEAEDLAGEATATAGHEDCAWV